MNTTNIGKAYLQVSSECGFSVPFRLTLRLLAGEAVEGGKRRGAKPPTEFYDIVEKRP